MKYMGSKNRLAKHLVPIINRYLEDKSNYVEPFVGGANLIDKVRKDRNLIGVDYNQYLIQFWIGLQNGFVPKDFYTRDEYEFIKSNKDLDRCLTGYVGFNCSYSGKWFGGFAGKVTTKGGKVRDYQAEAKRNVLTQKENILDIKFLCGDYKNLKPEDSVVYCDPPYRGTTKYRDEIDYEEFYDWCRRLRDAGNIVLVSEYEMPDDFTCIWELEVKSSLSANGVSGGNKKSTEKLFLLG